MDQRGEQPRPEETKPDGQPGRAGQRQELRYRPTSVRQTRLGVQGQVGETPREETLLGGVVLRHVRPKSGQVQEGGHKEVWPRVSQVKCFLDKIHTLTVST